MATEEHKQLASFIKNIHKNLRNEARILGSDVAWKLHCSNKNVLTEYSQAMRELATKHWDESENDLLLNSRIQWVYNFCTYYFFGTEILRQRKREEDIGIKLNLPLKLANMEVKAVLKLLDVGSCYNPFKIFNCFDVLAIDIAPGSDDVYQGDFLDLNSIRCWNPKSSTFDIIVFSLLLEYLPCPKQRLQCCVNAYNLLNFEGLLIIITPDSKHVGANAKFMKSWRYNLAQIGFSRIKYEKLTHIHCMAFRKSLKREIAARWALLQDLQDFFDQMYIPQDFNSVDNVGNESDEIDIDIESKLFMLNELPNVID